MRKFILCLIGFFILEFGMQVHASVTRGDIQIMARALGFTEKPLSGSVNVGVVYDPSNPNSNQDANKVQAILGPGKQFGKVYLIPKLIPITSVSGSSARIYFLTAGLGGNASSVLAASKANQILCVTTDLPQVRNGFCGLGIRSNPKIEILVNRKVAAETGTTFATAFRMMITEY